MKKKIWILMLVLALSVGTLASCIKECNHTFSDEWYSDAENHWHPATCEHGEESSDFGPHVDADENSLCDICSLEVGHDHTFASDWSINDTHHWKAATCSHTNQKKDNALHADEDLDTKCDTCGHHVHDVNAAGYCKHSGCGEKVAEVDETSLETLVNAFLVQAGHVNGGHIEYEVTVPSNAGNYYASYAQSKVDFELGNAFAHYKMFSLNKTYDRSGKPIEVSDTLDVWHEADGAETFSLESYDGGKNVSLVASDPNKLIGYYYNLSGFVDGDGAETFLFNIYTAAITDNVSNLVIEIDPETNSGSFSFSALVVQESTIAVGDNPSDVGEIVYNVNYYETSVSFSYTDDMVLVGLDITIDRYTNDAGALESGTQNLKDVDIEYDPETGSIKFVKYNEQTKQFEDADSATADTYSYSITQTVGEREATNPYTKSQFIPDSFNLYYTKNSNGTLTNKYMGEAINTQVLKTTKLYFGDCMPAEASLSFVANMVKVRLYRNGEEIVDCDDPINKPNPIATAMLAGAGENISFMFIPKEDGVYRMEISLIGKTYYTIQFHVGNVSIEDVVVGENQFAVKVTETYEWANKVSFTATEAGKYYFNLPSGVGFINAKEYDAANGDPAKMPNPYFDYNNAQVVDGMYKPGSFSIELEAGETIEFYVNATKRGVFLIDYFY